MPTTGAVFTVNGGKVLHWTLVELECIQGGENKIQSLDVSEERQVQGEQSQEELNLSRSVGLEEVQLQLQKER